MRAAYRAARSVMISLYTIILFCIIDSSRLTDDIDLDLPRILKLTLDFLADLSPEEEYRHPISPPDGR